MQEKGYESRQTELGRIFYKAGEIEFGANPQLVLTDFYGEWVIGVKEIRVSIDI